VQTPELQAMQQEKDTLVEQMAQMKDQLEKYERQIELLKGGNSSSQPIYFSTELSKSLSSINQKGVEIEKLKKKIETLQDQAKDKDKVISEYQKIKSNLKAEIEQLKHKKVGKAYLIGARHLIWDHIITEIGKIWECFKVVDEEKTLIDEAEKVVQQDFLDLGNNPQIAGRMIKFLNTHSRDALIEKGN
jgi:SMC interacting uncharacterized protein involved in chromosome segregation